MGFLNSLRNTFNDVANAVGAGDLLTQFSSRDEVEAFVAAFAYVATSDGVLEKEEKVAIGQFFGKVFPSFDLSKLTTQFNKVADVALDDMSRASALDELEDVRGNVVVANKILSACVGLAKKDGTLEDEEKVAIREIAAFLGVAAPAAVA